MKNQNNRLRPGDSIDAFIALVAEGQKHLNEAELLLAANPSLWDKMTAAQRAEIQAARDLMKTLPQRAN